MQVCVEISTSLCVADSDFHVMPLLIHMHTLVISNRSLRSGSELLYVHNSLFLVVTIDFSPFLKMHFQLARKNKNHPYHLTQSYYTHTPNIKQCFQGHCITCTWHIMSYNVRKHYFLMIFDTSDGEKSWNQHIHIWY